MPDVDGWMAGGWLREVGGVVRLVGGGSGKARGKGVVGRGFILSVGHFVSCILASLCVAAVLVCLSFCLLHTHAGAITRASIPVMPLMCMMSGVRASADDTALLSRGKVWL